MFHMTGTNTITSFTVPVGFQYAGCMVVVADAAYQTTAGNNIGTTVTGVATENILWCYDRAAGLWYAANH
jgi:hypothetical protein